MDDMHCRKIGFSKEFIACFSRLFFEEKILKKGETAKEKELVAIQQL